MQYADYKPVLVMRVQLHQHAFHHHRIKPEPDMFKMGKLFKIALYEINQINSLHPR